MKYTTLALLAVLASCNYKPRPREMVNCVIDSISCNIQHSPIYAEPTYTLHTDCNVNIHVNRHHTYSVGDTVAYIKIK
jgi:hypothetical protein